MKGLKDYRFKLVWASTFMGVKAFEQFFMPLEETCMSGISGCGLGLKEGFMPGSCWDGRGGGFTESCRSCRVFCASCLRLIGLLGLKTEWNCAFRAFALSVSAV